MLRGYLFHWTDAKNFWAKCVKLYWQCHYACSRLGPGLRPVHDLFWGQICSLGSTRDSAPNPGVYPLEDTGEVEKQRISSAALHRISCSRVGSLSSVALFRCIFSFGTFFGFIRVYTVIFSDPIFFGRFYLYPHFKTCTMPGHNTKLIKSMTYRHWFLFQSLSST